MTSSRAKSDARVTRARRWAGVWVVASSVCVACSLRPPSLDPNASSSAQAEPEQREAPEERAEEDAVIDDTVIDDAVLADCSGDETDARVELVCGDLIVTWWHFPGQPLAAVFDYFGSMLREQGVTLGDQSSVELQGRLAGVREYELRSAPDREPQLSGMFSAYEDAATSVVHGYECKAVAPGIFDLPRCQALLQRIAASPLPATVFEAPSMPDTVDFVGRPLETRDCVGRFSSNLTCEAAQLTWQIMPDLEQARAAVPARYELVSAQFEPSGGTTTPLAAFECSFDGVPAECWETRFESLTAEVRVFLIAVELRGQAVSAVCTYEPAKADNPEVPPYPCGELLEFAVLP